MTVKELEIQLALGTLSSNRRLKLAGSPGTPKRILTKLAADTRCYIRSWVAMNPNTPKKILVKLATDEKKWIRRWVVRNPNTPKKVRAKLREEFPIDHC